MNKSKNTSAFPFEFGSQSGMTMRDYFAAKAMQAYFSDPNASFSRECIEVAAQTSFRIADAMLAERYK